MAFKKVIPVEDAVALIRDGDVVATSGYGGHGVPEQLLIGLEARFLETGGPRDLTLIHASGQGDAKDKGLGHLGHEGLLKRVVGGYYGLAPKIAGLAVENRIEAYNFPEGVITNLYRDIAAGKPGTVSRVGLGTFVDPRIEGGKLNEAAVEDLIEVIALGGEELLFFKAFPINVGFVRGTTADPDGNVTMEKEALRLEDLQIALAVKNSGGVVLCQVERIAESGSLDARRVRIPGNFVDAIVVAEPENHMQNFGTRYDPALSGELRVPLETLPAPPLDEKKVIARRAAMELVPGGIVNLGVGLPDAIGAIAGEERIQDLITLTADPGVFGGVPMGGPGFGAAANYQATIDHASQFDFIDGGGLDGAFLGFAECDAAGNINASRFSGRISGCGGFINISQNSKKVVFVGTFTSGGLEVYVTERCVFRLTGAGLELVEVAPGIDIDRDILSHMPFRPVVEAPRQMDAGLFRAAPLGLRERMLDIRIEDRISYDAATNTLFLNYAGMRVRTQDDIDKIKHAVEATLEPLGKRVNSIVNYDSFSADDDVIDRYLDLVRHVEKTYYLKVSRYTTSGFMRLKLGEELAKREVSSHVFETRREARRHLDQA